MKILSPKQDYNQKIQEMHNAFFEWGLVDFNIESKFGKKYYELRNELEKNPLRKKFKEKLSNLFK